MNANAHQEAQELLPWLANGSLTGTERERVQAHLQVCADCRTELATLHTLRAAGQVATPQPDLEAALARLLPQLDAEPDPGPRVPGWRTGPAANDRSWLRAAVVLQFCAIAVLAVLLARAPAGADVSPVANADTGAGAYRLLGAGAGRRSSLVVTFHPDTPEREVRRIMLASGARVVGGPTVTGAWLLDTEDEPGKIVVRLRAEASVTLAEQLGAEERP